MSVLTTSLAPEEFRLFREELGFLPAHLPALSRIPRLVEAEAAMSAVILFRQGALSRARKHWMLYALAAAREDGYSLALHDAALRREGAGKEQRERARWDFTLAGLSAIDVALIEFALHVGQLPSADVSPRVHALRRLGVDDAGILEAALVAAWGAYWHLVGSGLRAAPCVDLPPVAPSTPRRTVLPPAARFATELPRQPYVGAGKADAAAEAILLQVAGKFGYIPNVFRCQTSRPDVMLAQLRASELWLCTGDVLTRLRKESIFLAVAASNLNSYCVAMHCEFLKRMGISKDETRRIALDHHQSALPAADKTLLDTCLHLSRTPGRFGPGEWERLRTAGFSREEITEAVVITAITHMFNTLDTALGVEPDFDSGVPLGNETRLPAPLPATLPTPRAATQAATQADDPDLAYVLRVQQGDLAAFEELVRRNGRRVSRTIAAILGPESDLDDAVQDTFVKAFEHIGGFEGRSRFSSWLTRIAVNAALQRIRSRRDMVSLDDGYALDGDAMPRQVEAWQDNPEQAYSKAELHGVVIDAVMKLPDHYRAVVILRDLQELSAEETATALGLTVANVKSRLFRARLALREALAPHFTRKDAERDSC